MLLKRLAIQAIENSLMKSHICEDFAINSNSVRLNLESYKSGPFVNFQILLNLPKFKGSIKELERNAAKFVGGIVLEAPLLGSSFSEIKPFGDNLRAIKFKLHVDPKALVSETLAKASIIDEKPWLNSYLFCNKIPETIVVEFSSPNIAKPFHVGHLRSTIIGNFISNLHESIGDKVVRINYLGDWGTQFALLNLALQGHDISQLNTEEDKIKALYDLYVDITKKAESNPSLMQEALKIFRDMELGSSDNIRAWEYIRALSLQNLEPSYERLGIKFDVFEGESMYKYPALEQLLSEMKSKNLLHTEEDGRTTIKLSSKSVTLLKSDNSSLYLTRDIAAAISRHHKYNFDKHYYVVDSSQAKHFKALFQILKLLDCAWSEKMSHVSFGRIRGMSTRKGTAIFLKDVLDEAKTRMVDRQKASKNTKDINYSEVADIVGISAVLIQDLRQRRNRDYDFDWDLSFQNNGATGIRLQYTHCCLLNLEQKCQSHLNPNADPRCLTEPEALRLIIDIAKFDEVLYSCTLHLEACLMVNYLFSLCHSSMSAYNKLEVKGQSAPVAQARLLMFTLARMTLGQGMKILGIKPLSQM